MKFGYADPPYLGRCGRYGHRHRLWGCFDRPATQRRVVRHLIENYPEAWAFSCSASSLADILPAARGVARVGAWVKPFWGFKPGVAPSYAWEPIIFGGGRRRARTDYGPPDYVVANPSLTAHGKQIAQTDPDAILGRKPAPFWRWLFAALNLEPGDEFHDLFPGTGAGGEAWAAWCDEWSGRPVSLPLFADAGA